MRAQLVILLLVALVLILVTAQNPNPVPLQFLSWQARQVPLIIIILVSLLVGMIVSAFIALINQFKLKERIHRLERDLEEAKQSLPASHEENLES